MQGTVLADRYRLVDWLGGGSMGDVWAAEDEVLGRRVAVKVVKPALLEEDGFAERFHAEARVMAQLRHPGIVGVHDYGHDGSDGRRPVAYLVMELIEGEPLSAVLERRGALPVAETLRTALQVLEALEAAHEAGIVHRDIKPANLMVREDRTVIADFGIARPGCDARLTVPGMVLGTAAYQAPEQASSGTVTASADLYALGVLLHECLTGRLPFDGETALEVILQHLTAPVPPLPEGVPAPVGAIVGRAMAKEPGERWPDAASMAAAVREALAQLGEEVPPAPPRRRPAARRAPRHGRRVRALVGVTVLTLLCVAGAAGATVIRPNLEAAREGAVAEVPAAPPGPVPGAPVADRTRLSPASPASPTSPTETPQPSAASPSGSGSPAAEPAPVLPAPSPPVPAATGASPAPAPAATAPAQPTLRESATPSAPAATTQPAEPTQKPKPSLPATGMIVNRFVALDNSYSADKDGNLVDMYTVNNSSAQNWRLERIDESRYYLRNGSTNYTKVLDLDVKTGNVQIWTNPPAGENQMWVFTPVEGGYQIMNYGTKQCLTSDGVARWARVAACSNGDNQVWTVS